jgi:drug/metabolite transporter (DMT)-like permease
VLRTLLAVQVFGLIAFFPVIVFKAGMPSGPLSAWAAMAAVSVVSCAGVFLLYRAFEIGTLSLVSPIASGFAVVTAAIALAFGERPPGLAIGGAALLIFGVVVVSRTRSEGSASVDGLAEAVGAIVGFGIYFWAVGELTPELGVYWPVAITRVVELVLALLVIWLRPPPPAGEGDLRTAMPFLVAAAVFDTGAILAFNLGVASAYTTTTTALTSLYSTVTILLAWVILRERLARTQWAGVGVVLAGVFLVSL